MNEYEQIHLERRIEALMDHLGLCFVEEDCPVEICHEGRWPDGDLCADCGGLAKLIKVKRIP